MLFGPLGRFLGSLGARLGLSWASLGWYVSALGCFLTSRDPPDLDFLEVFGWVLNIFGDRFCMLSAAPRPALRNAFIDAVTALLRFLVLLLLLFWCGGLCAAHPPPPEGMPSVPDRSYKCLT